MKSRSKILDKLCTFSFIPKFVKKKIRKHNDMIVFNSILPKGLKNDNLKKSNEVKLSNIFETKNLEEIWRKFENDREKKNIILPDSTGGVNPGDRRAIFHLLSYFKPNEILEVGTHIGASTLYMASALKLFTKSNIKLTTVDIRDVNSKKDQPWMLAGASHSPKAALELLDIDSCVDFVTSRSISYLENSKKKFDFIFLDGEHTASAVYQEIPLALNLLNPNGVILLHDFFPNLKPLWDNNHIIEGPCLAVNRFNNEGAGLTALPLGKLPWKTKLGSNVTSLALLLK